LDPVENKPLYYRVTINKTGIGVEGSYESDFSILMGYPYAEMPYNVLTNNYIIRPGVREPGLRAGDIMYINFEKKLGQFKQSMLEIYLELDGNISFQYKYIGTNPKEIELFKPILEPNGWSLLSGIVWGPLEHGVKQ
jgi:hypothetical protein